MKMITSKIAILETLNDMDNGQAEKVLAYIKGLLYANPLKSEDYHQFKDEALREIRQALSQRDSDGMIPS